MCENSLILSGHAKRGDSPLALQKVSTYEWKSTYLFRKNNYSHPKIKKRLSHVEKPTLKRRFFL